MPLRDNLDEIVRMRVEEGAMLQEIAVKFGVTRERVRQVLAGEGFTDIPQGKVTRCVLCAYSADKTVCEIAIDAGVSKSAAYAIVHNKGLPFIHKTHLGVDRVYANDELLEHLRELSRQLGRTPGMKDLCVAKGPSHTLYYKYFGSLVEAQRLAGLKPNGRGAAGHRSRPEEKS